MNDDVITDTSEIGLFNFHNNGLILDSVFFQMLKTNHVMTCINIFIPFTSITNYIISPDQLTCVALCISNFIYTTYQMFDTVLKDK